MRDKAFNIAKNPKYDWYQRGLASMVYKSFDKEAASSNIDNDNTLDQQLAEEFQKPIIRKFKKRKVYSPFINNIWGADLVDIQLISKFYRGFRFRI